MLPDISDLSSTAQVLEPPIKTGQTARDECFLVTTNDCLAPPPADLPAIIPLTSAPPPPPPPAPPLPAPPTPVAPLLIPPPPPLLGDAAGGEGALPSIKNEVDDYTGGSGNALMDQIMNFAKKSKLKKANESNPVNPAPMQISNEQESIMDKLKNHLGKRRDLITGKTSPSTPSEKPIAAPAPPPVTGGAFTDAIAQKAKEVADEQQRRKDDSDADDGSDNEEEWNWVSEDRFSSLASIDCIDASNFCFFFNTHI